MNEKGKKEHEIKNIKINEKEEEDLKTKHTKGSNLARDDTIRTSSFHKRFSS